jgi:hypothetical protein
VLLRDISSQVAEHGSVAKIPATAVGNTRNDMYLTSEAIRFLMKDKEAELSKDDISQAECLQNCNRPIDEIHSNLGENCRRYRARPRHNGRLETDCHHRR